MPTKGAKKAKGAKEKASSRRAAGGRVLVKSRTSSHTTTLDATKFEAAKKALFAALPKAPPGITQAEMFAAVKQRIDKTLFPGGAKSEWWTKSVQLDQEKRGVVRRTPGKPIRWYRP